MISLIATLPLVASPALPVPADDDLLSTAAAAGSFDTLVSLVVTAGLDGALRGEGPLTVFAPTDDAFAALGEETLAELRLPENRDRLTEILTYHVVGQPIRIPAHPPRHRITEAATLQGGEIRFRRDGRRVFVNDAEVAKRDIRCSNGLIQVIDSVLLPEPSVPGLADLVRSDGRFGTLLAALDAAGLTGALDTESPLTILAPTDEAFAALPEGTVASLLKPENKGELARILKDHVLAGRLSGRSLAGRETVSSLGGTELAVAIRGGAVEVAGARLVENDLDASNGLVHVLDRVIVVDAPRSNEHAAAELPELLRFDASWNDHINEDGVRAKRIEIKVGGSGSVKLTNLEADEVVTTIGGGGRVTLSGETERHEARVAGGAALSALKLVTARTDVRVGGGGDATVYAEEALKLSANAGARVRYVDTGATVERDVNQYAQVEVIAH